MPVNPRSVTANNLVLGFERGFEQRRDGGGEWDPLVVLLVETAPPPLLTVSEWSDEHRVLSSTASAEPGRWKTSRTPYLREPMDLLSRSSPIRAVTFMKGAQVGGTEMCVNWLGYIVHLDPGPTLIVWPTEAMAKRNSRSRIRTLIDSSRDLQLLIAPPKSRDSANTLLVKEFRGGDLVMLGANSPTGLRSMPKRFILLDEVDGYPGDVGGEGDPVKLAEARARTFSNRKVLRVSTPTIAGRSRIERLFDLSDQRYYNLPCPHCGEFQALVWEQIHWEAKGRKVDRVWYECAHCKKEIEEWNKPGMLEKGKWIARNPDGLEPGFHLSALYSPLGWFSWKDAVVEFLACKDDSDVKVFQNTVLGLPWNEDGEAPDWQELQLRAEPYDTGTIPSDEICILTAGADVQADRIEMEVVGWSKDLQSWSVDYVVLSGDTTADQVWDDLAEALQKSYRGAKQLCIKRLAIDTGYRAVEVYRWARQWRQSVIAVKGNHHLLTPLGSSTAVDVQVAKGLTLKAGLRLWPVGVSLLKSELYGWLRRVLKGRADGAPCGHGWPHLPQHYPDEWFQQLTAERLVSRGMPDGRTKWVWEQTRPRNEALDCRVYARAALASLNVARWSDARWQKEGTRAAVPARRRGEVPAQQSPRRRRKTTVMADYDWDL